jgi:hypothetical protein
MGALYMLKLRSRAKGDAVGIAENPHTRTSAQISIAALNAHYHRMTAGAHGVPFVQEYRPVDALLQNWRWYIRENWKQALVTSLCYLLMFLLWRRLV